MKNLPLKLGIFVVLLFSAVVATCLLWTPVKIRYYVGKLRSENPKKRVVALGKLLEIGMAGKEGMAEFYNCDIEEIEFIGQYWKNPDTFQYKERGFPVQLAAIRGFEIATARLLDKGADIKAVHRGNQDYPFTLAAAHGHIDVVRVLLKYGLDVNDKCYEWSNPLRAAILNRQEEMALFLLELGLQKIDRRYKPLPAAAEKGLPLVVDRLLKDKHNYREIETDAICLAAENGHDDVVRVLLDHGVNGNVTQRLMPCVTPLILAIEKGHTQTVKTMLAYNIDPDMPDHHYRLPLIEAICDNNSEIVRALIENGADVNLRDGKIDEDGTSSGDGNTPLIKAIYEAKDEIIYMLLDNNADVERKNLDEDTPLNAAICMERNILAMELIKRGAGIRKKGCFGDTPLHMAALCGNVEMVKFLIEKGCDVSCRNAFGAAVLHRAGWSDSTEVLRILVENGADVNALDEDNKTPLHYAAENVEIEMLRFLIEHGAKINARDSGGNTSLGYLLFEQSRKYPKQRDFNAIIKYLRVHGGKTGKEIREQENKETRKE